MPPNTRKQRLQTPALPRTAMHLHQARYLIPHVPRAPRDGVTRLTPVGISTEMTRPRLGSVDTSGLAPFRQRRPTRADVSRAWRHGAAARLCRGYLLQSEAVGDTSASMLARSPLVGLPAGFRRSIIPRGASTRVHRLRTADVRAAPPDVLSARHEPRRNRSERLPVAAAACSGVSAQLTAAGFRNFSTSHFSICSLLLTMSRWLARSSVRQSLASRFPSTPSLLSRVLSSAAPDAALDATPDTKALGKSSKQPDVVLPPNDHYKLLIIGAGWAGYQMLTQCNKHIADIEAHVGRPVDIEVISRRNVSVSATPLAL